MKLNKTRKCRWNSLDKQGHRAIMEEVVVENRQTWAIIEEVVVESRQTWPTTELHEQKTQHDKMKHADIRYPFKLIISIDWLINELISLP